jgi:UDP-N-acetylglucosamine transferase subunit ALG13
MVFVTVGTQTLGFERLLNEVQNLVKKGIIDDNVEIQTGFTKFHSATSQITCFNFLSQEEMDFKIKNAEYIITHGGVGCILGALHYQKKIIAVPRLKEFREHINNHQLEIIENFSNAGFLLSVYNIKELEMVVKQIGNFIPNKYIGTNTKLIAEIKNTIDLL